MAKNPPKSARPGTKTPLAGGFHVPEGDDAPPSAVDRAVERVRAHGSPEEVAAARRKASRRAKKGHPPS